ncbi:hypothetical protein QN239_02475 [Mycolicibacterium sp. Y3]
MTVPHWVTQSGRAVIVADPMTSITRPASSDQRQSRPGTTELSAEHPATGSDTAATGHRSCYAAGADLDTAGGAEHLNGGCHTRDYAEQSEQPRGPGDSPGDRCYCGRGIPTPQQHKFTWHTSQHANQPCRQLGPRHPA